MFSSLLVVSWDVSRVVLFSDVSISCACRFSIMVFACVMLPSSFRWYPSLSIASLPIAIVSSVLMKVTCCSSAIDSRLSVYLTMAYVAVRSVVVIGGGWIMVILTSGLLVLMVLMLSLMFSAACWCGMCLLASLVPIMMSTVSFFVRSVVDGVPASTSTKRPSKTEQVQH